MKMKLTRVVILCKVIYCGPPAFPFDRCRALTATKWYATTVIIARAPRLFARLYSVLLLIITILLRVGISITTTNDDDSGRCVPPSRRCSKCWRHLWVPGQSAQCTWYLGLFVPSSGTVSDRLGGTVLSEQHHLPTCLQSLSLSETLLSKMRPTSARMSEMPGRMLSIQPVVVLN